MESAFAIVAVLATGFFFGVSTAVSIGLYLEKKFNRNTELEKFRMVKAVEISEQTGRSCVDVYDQMAQQ